MHTTPPRLSSTVSDILLSRFENPNLDPLSANFGRVTNNTSSTMRFLLFQARVKF